MSYKNFYQKGIYPAQYRVIAIGDIHGDLNATIIALSKARVIKIINNKIIWTGGKTHVVQIGDIVDRGGRMLNYNDEDSEFKIIQLFLNLQIQSRKAGGAFHCLLGNHELMNIVGIYDYVSPMGKNHFNSIHARRHFFAPGKQFTKLLAGSWNVIIKIGSWLFVHGGLNSFISQNYTIPKINNLMKMFLNGNTSLFNTSEFQKLFINNKSLLWNRDFATNRPNCVKLTKNLNNFNAKHLVIGHTPQQTGINYKCGGKVWRIDTAMSEAFGKRNSKNNRIQILEILRNGKMIKIL